MQPSQLTAQKSKQQNLTLKTATCWTSPIVDNKPQKDAYKSSVTQYNDAGLKISTTDYRSDGNVANVYHYEYKDNQQHSYVSNSDGSRTKTQTETYNENGRLTTRLRLDADQSQLDLLKLEYNKGQKKLEEYFDQNNEQVYSIQYIYNPEQGAIRESYTNHKNKESYMAAIDLDTKAVPIAYTQYKTSGPLVKSIAYKRDGEGRVLQKETFLPNKKLQLKEVYEYTEDSMTHSVFAGEEQRLVEHVVYKYVYYK